MLKDFPKDRKQEYIRQYGDWYAYLSHLNTDDARKTWKEKTSYYEDLFTHSYNHGIMFNRKLLARANLTVSDIQTASQVLKAFEKVKKLTAEDGQSTIPLLLEGNQYLDSSISCLIGSFGAEVIDDNGNYTERFLQPECKDAFAFLNTAFRKGYAFSEDLTLDNLQMRDLIADGRVFCYIGNTSNTSVDATRWVSAGPILSDSGKRPVMSIDLSVPTGWMQTFVSKSCKNPELVARFFDYMTSDEGLLYSNYGVENEDYTFDSDGYIQRTARGQQRFHDSNDMLGLFWNFYNVAWDHSLIPVPEKGSMDDCLNQIQTAFARYPDTYVYDSALLRLPDNYISPDSEEGQIESTLEAYRKEQIPKILSASSDTEFEKQYQLFVTTQKELGAEKLDQKINRQMQENFSYYGKKIEKVNPQMQDTSKSNGETKP